MKRFFLLLPFFLPATMGCISDGPSSRIVETIEVGDAPHGIRYTADGRHALLAESGANAIAVVDLEQGYVTERWEAGEVPLDLVSDGNGGYWVTQFRSYQLVHFDGAGRELGRIEVADGPSLFTSRAPNGRYGLVAERGDRFYVFDPQAGAIIQEFETGPRPYPGVITRDGILAFVPNSADGTVSIFDLLNWEEVTKVHVGGRPRGGALTPDDVSYVVATSDPDALVYVNTASFEVEARVTERVGPAPFSVCIPDRGGFGVVNDSGGNTVGILDLANRRIVEKLEVGDQPIVMRAHQDNRRVVVSTEEGNAVSIIELPAPEEPGPFVERNEVLVLGMIHGDHETSESYGLETVEALIRAIDPDVVCIEIPPNRIEAAWSGFHTEGRLVEPRSRRFPEYRDVLFPLTRELDFEIVATAGWTERMASYRRDALRRIAEDPSRAGEWAEYEASQEAAAKAIRAGGGADDPRWIHTDTYDAAAELELSVYNRLFNDELGPGGWDNINAAHYENIERALDERSGRGLRILITYGAYHKGWFLRELRKRDDIRLLDVGPFLDQIESDRVGP